MTDNYDQLALSWVRKEINNTLDQARQGLENFAEDPQDQTQIQFCINCLHQVQGTLQMLDFSGAAKLAAEMETLAEKMASEQSLAVESSFEVLMRALLQMPGYLERVEEGQKDIPVILLPLINELRAASNSALVTERELFSAGNYDVIPPKAQEAASEADRTTSFQDNAKKLRSHFQKGLTGLIRGQRVKECLSRIHKVLLRLESLTEGHLVSRLWWVADGFVLSIAEGGLYKKKEVHQLLAQVDKQIKRLSDEGSAALDDVIPEKLLAELLYFVARSKSKNERIIALKSEFNLEAGLADSEEVQQRQARMARPDASAMSNVVEAINEELTSVKDQLDLFVRSQVKDSNQLQSLVNSLTTVADTLTLLELAIPRDVIRQQVGTVQKLIDTNQLPSDAVVMDVAGALLFVEANLNNINLDLKDNSGGEEKSTELSQAQAKDSQVDEATKALIKVARKNMQIAKDKMIDYIASGFDREALVEVPAILEEVMGGVKIVKYDRAAETLKVAKAFIENKIVNTSSQPKEEHLDSLADVITSVEYYLEASEEGGQLGVGSILNGAQDSVDALSKVLSEPELEAVDTTTESTEEHVSSNETQDIERFEPQPFNKPTAEVIPLIASSADKVVDETLIDEEVLEIFLEEAEEETEIIEEMLPRWINDVQDQEALTTLRRSFHTLKGSGRLVGAKTIGEVSWSVENMLNKVIEDSIPAEAPVFEVLNEAITMIPSLVEAFSKQRQVDSNYQELIAKAEHVSEGKNLSDFVFDVATELAEEEVADTPDETIDPVLLEIFTSEADGHLKSINEFIDSAPSQGSIAVTDELIRALHTLKGSAHMAGVEPIAGVTGPWEKHARLVKGSNQRFDQTSMTLLKNTHEYLLSTIEQLKISAPLDVESMRLLQAKVIELSDSNKSDDESNVKLRDQQFVSIFLTEGQDILQEVAQQKEQLLQNKNDNALKKLIFKELETFNHGSSMLAISELDSLAKSTQNLASFVVDRDGKEEEFCELLGESVETLISMLNKIASDEDLQSSENLIQRISSWMENASVNLAPEDMDVELVELFVEEGEELIEAARELLPRWKTNIRNKEVVGELRRIFHTLKGSSRMAGAMGIGELGFAAEEIFNTVIDLGREQSDSDYNVTEFATDKLEILIAELKTLKWPVEPTDDIQRIRRYLVGEGFEEPSVAEEDSESKFFESIATETVDQGTDKLVDIEATDSEPALEEINQEDAVEEIPMIVDTIADDEELELELVEEIEPVDETSLSETQDENNDQVEVVEFESLVEDESIPEATGKESDAEEFDEEVTTENIDTQDIGTEETEVEEIAAEVTDTQDTETEETEVEGVEPESTEDYILHAVKDASKTEVTTEDTIAPAAPIEVVGDIHKIELDEDGEEVLEIYLEEAEELLVSLDEGLHEWSESLENKNAIDLLQRTLHTFKGGARLSDLVILGDLTHEMETYFERVNSGQLTAKQEDVSFLLQGYDVIESLVTEVRDQRQMTMPSQYMSSLDKLIKGESITAEPIESDVVELLKTETEDESVVEKTEKSSAKVVSFEQKKRQQEESVIQKPAQVNEVIRVPSEQLESLVNLAGETSIFRSRLEQQMSVLRYNLEEMNSTVDRLREQLRNLDIETDAQISYRREVSGAVEYEDFDPLEMDRYTRQQELTRGLSESAVDLLSLKETLDMLTADSETLLLQQGRVNTEMQESLMRTRMIPFESLVPRLRRMVRQISTELGKTIELSISANGEMDRTVLERMVAPLEHMLRNAMDHGVESPEERLANNKPEKGSVKISMFREGNEVFIKLQDDGRGLNLKAIRKKAIEKRLINEKSDLSDHELQQLILQAGFSTAEQVTQISGRGVGMDVVNSEIKQLGGVIEIDSYEGIGTTFIVKLPFTMSVNHALMVRIGEEVHAIPLSDIEGILRVSPFELEEYYTNSESRFEYAGVDYSMYYLGQILDHSASANLQGVTQPLPVLLLNSSEHPTAIQVDELLGSREIVVKSIGSQLSTINGLSGATILGDGRVVVILDMPALIRRIDAETIDTASQVAVVEETGIPTVMVVDDSITVRKVTTRLLERHDFEVITAKDGIDALSVLNERKPDVMLLDIEMPRMDGFELATIIRHDDNLKDLPIIMITSRTGEKHRERAEQIGVNQYMGKPYNEVDLLESISNLLPVDKS